MADEAVLVIRTEADAGQMRPTDTGPLASAGSGAPPPHDQGVLGTGTRKTYNELLQDLHRTIGSGSARQDVASVRVPSATTTAFGSYIDRAPPMTASGTLVDHSPEQEHLAKQLSFQDEVAEGLLAAIEAESPVELAKKYIEYIDKAREKEKDEKALEEEVNAKISEIRPDLSPIKRRAQEAIESYDEGKRRKAENAQVEQQISEERPDLSPIKRRAQEAIEAHDEAKRKKAEDAQVEQQIVEERPDLSPVRQRAQQIIDTHDEAKKRKVEDAEAKKRVVEERPDLSPVRQRAQQMIDAHDEAKKRKAEDAEARQQLYKERPETKPNAMLSVGKAANAALSGDLGGAMKHIGGEGGALEAMGIGGAAVEAMAGPIGIALAAKQLVSAIVGKVTSAITGAIDTGAQVGADMATNNFQGLLSTVHQGIDGFADNLMMAVPFLGAFVKVGNSAVMALETLTYAFISRAHELAEYSGGISAAEANAGVRQMQADINEANVLGPDMASLIDAQSRMSTAFQDAILPIKDAILTRLLPIIELLADGMEAAKEVQEGYQEFEKEHQTAMAAVWAAVTPAFLSIPGLLREIRKNTKPKDEDEATVKLWDDFMNGIAGRVL